MERLGDLSRAFMQLLTADKGAAQPNNGCSLVLAGLMNLAGHAGSLLIHTMGPVVRAGCMSEHLIVALRLTVAGSM